MIKGILLTARPSHWVKNLIIFAALIFAREYGDFYKIGLTVLVFAAFCLGVSAVYIINDILDRENDKNHPVKCNRPMASGSLTVPVASGAAVLLLITGLALALWINIETFIVLGLYIVINYAYSIYIKQLVILDVMTIASGFVLRAIAGGVAIAAPISPWFLVCTSLLALFLGFAKRRHELSLLSADAVGHRKALEHYSIPFLDQMTSVVTSSTVVAYAFYTLSPETIEHSGTRWLFLTIPFVLYGIFRYLYLIFKRDQGGNPTKLMLTDPPLLLCVGLWLISVMLIFKFL
jgi:4-hydroxybenzoate polyprenyltransferase